MREPEDDEAGNPRLVRMMGAGLTSSGAPSPRSRLAAEGEPDLITEVFDRALALVVSREVQ
jgi:hypothetical protein